jgi:hypothetical protein
MIRIEVDPNDGLAECCHLAISAAANANDVCEFNFCGVELKARATDTVRNLMKDFTDRASRCASDIRVTALERQVLALVTLCGNLVDRIEQLESR